MRASQLRFFGSVDYCAKKVCDIASNAIEFQTIHTILRGSVGYIGCTEKDIIAPFVAAKPRGYEVGHFVNFSGLNYLITMLVGQLCIPVQDIFLIQRHLINFLSNHF